MTEAEWHRTDDPAPLLDFVAGRLGPRKLRLFAVACSRRILHLPLGAEVAGGIDLAERVAEGRLSAQALDAARQRTYLATEQKAEDAARDTPYNAARLLAFHATHSGPASSVPEAWPDWFAYDPAERAVQCQLLRDITGNPFARVRFDPVWRAAYDNAVVKLAESIYEDRDWERMPILGDALVDAGCGEAVLLDHAYGPGPHVRGCWLLDLILERS